MAQYYYHDCWKSSIKELENYYEKAKLEAIFETLSSLERVIKNLAKTGTELTTDQIAQIIDARLDNILIQMERNHLIDYDKEVND